MYVYIKSEPRLWTVGFYAPNGEWIPEAIMNAGMTQRKECIG